MPHTRVRRVYRAASSTGRHCTCIFVTGRSNSPAPRVPVPVVILSTGSDRDDVARAYDLLASAYLVKHGHFSEFVEQVERFVEFWHNCRFPSRTDQPT